MMKVILCNPASTEEGVSSQLPLELRSIRKKETKMSLRREKVALLALLGFLCTLVGFAESKVIAAYVIPHGDFALDPSLVSSLTEKLNLHMRILI